MIHPIFPLNQFRHSVLEFQILIAKPNPDLYGPPSIISLVVTSHSSHDYGYIYTYQKIRCRLGRPMADQIQHAYSSVSLFIIIKEQKVKVLGKLVSSCY